MIATLLIETSKLLTSILLNQLNCQNDYNLDNNYQ